jgi:hypothetical protein
LIGSLQAISLVEAQKPQSGNYPNSMFQSSTTITPEFLVKSTSRDYTTRLAKGGMPFLYNIVYCVLANLDENKVESSTEHHKDHHLDNCNAKELKMEGIAYANCATPQMHSLHR